MLIATFCNNPCLSRVALHGRQLSKLNSLAFHWHRTFQQGSTGPLRAVRLACKILASSGAMFFQIAAGIRLRGERALDLQGRDITEVICSQAQHVQSAMDILLEASLCMGAHPLRFGQPLQEAIAEDRTQKDENQDEENRLERWRKLGYYVADAELDLRM